MQPVGGGTSINFGQVFIKDGAEKNEILFQGKTRTKNGMKGLTLFGLSLSLRIVQL